MSAPTLETPNDTLTIRKIFLWAQDKNTDNSLGYELNYTDQTKQKELIKGEENFTPQTIERIRETLTEICEPGKPKTDNPVHRKLTHLSLIHI